MTRNSAVVVGINEYYNLSQLRYAKRDAELVSQFLRDTAKAEIYLFSDDSPPIATPLGPDIKSQPTYATLYRFLRTRFEQPFLSADDNLWFFFAGHGLRHEGRDYIMPVDVDAGNIERTAIPLSYVTECLRRSGAGTIILLLDACRADGRRSTSEIGKETLPGLIIFFSCSPQEVSYEIEELQQGSFAYALIEGLSGGVNAATVERLEQYLRVRVPQINEQYGKPTQSPYATVEPISSAHLILLPESATLQDIQTLKIDALKAEANRNLKIARQLWIRVLSVSPGDPESIQAIERIAQVEATTQLDSIDPERTESKPTEENTLGKIGNLQGAENDLVSKKDQLGFKDYVQAFTDLIESPATYPPLTIGIFGSWGVGKSFLLHHISKEIKRRHEIRLKTKLTNYKVPRTYTVEFNAWEYSSAQIIWPCLVRRIMNYLEPQVSWGFPGRFVIKFWRNLQRQIEGVKGRLIAIFAIIIGLIIFSVWKFGLDISLIWSASIALGIGGIFKLVADTLSKPLSQWATTVLQPNDYGKQIDYMEEIRADLGLLAKRLKKNGDRILIIIDDLDRCEPQKAVEVLQAIKLLLDFDTFIVCLGIDARIITRAVEKHYAELLGPAGTSGYEYLDKIVQIPFQIPEPTLEEVRIFITQQLGAPTLSSRDLQPFVLSQEKFNQASIEVEAKTPTSASEMKESMPDELVPFTYEETQVFHSFARFLRPNPRHLKRLVNVYRLVRALAKYKNEYLILNNSDITICWLLMSGQWPYTTYSMLYYFEEMKTQKEEGKLADFPERDPLMYLFQKVSFQIEQNQDALIKQRRLDYNLNLLRTLLQSQEGRLSWKGLETIRQYTINFNPAVGVELKTELPVKFIADEQ
jgi:uncharacterized caspase-like protein